MFQKTDYLFLFLISFFMINEPFFSVSPQENLYLSPFFQQITPLGIPLLWKDTRASPICEAFPELPIIHPYDSSFPPTVLLAWNKITTEEMVSALSLKAPTLLFDPIKCIGALVIQTLEDRVKPQSLRFHYALFDNITPKFSKNVDLSARLFSIYPSVDLKLDNKQECIQSVYVHPSGPFHLVCSPNNFIISNIDFKKENRGAFLSHSYIPKHEAGVSEKIHFTFHIVVTKEFADLFSEFLVRNTYSLNAHLNSLVLMLQDPFFCQEQKKNQQINTLDDIQLIIETLSLFTAPSLIPLLDKKEFK